MEFPPHCVNINRFSRKQVLEAHAFFRQFRPERVGPPGNGNIKFNLQLLNTARIEIAPDSVKIGIQFKFNRHMQFTFKGTLGFRFWVFGIRCKTKGFRFLSNLIVLSPAQAGRYSYSYSKKSKADDEHEYEYEVEMTVLIDSGHLPKKWAFFNRAILGFNLLDR